MNIYGGIFVMQLYWNHTSAAFLQNTFSEEHLWRAASGHLHYNKKHTVSCFLSLFSVIIHQFHSYTKNLTLISFIPTPSFPHSQLDSYHSHPDFPHSHPDPLHFHPYSPHPALIPRIPTPIPCIPTLIPRIPTLIPRIPIALWSKLNVSQHSKTRSIRIGIVLRHQAWLGK